MERPKIYLLGQLVPHVHDTFTKGLKVVQSDKN